jgi:CxxC motif-containing protein
MLTVSPEGKIDKVSGNQCKKGREYALAEFQHPLRVLTATVLTEGSRRHLLAVRTDKAIPKEQLQKIMRATANLKVKPPVKAGQEIVHDILGTGANLISTGTL